MPTPDGPARGDAHAEGGRSPTRSGSSSSEATAAHALPGGNNFAWGLVTRNEVRPLLGPRAKKSHKTATRAIFRTVEPGVQYFTHEAVTWLELDQVVPIWEETGEARCYEMAWPGDGEPQAWSLHDLGLALRRWDGESPRAAARGLESDSLRELDAAARRLLQIVAHLHEHGCRAGLLNPHNVLLIPGKGGKELVLPDLGFVYQHTPGRTQVPRWLAADSPLTELWDDPPEEQQDIGDPARFGWSPLEAQYVRTDLRSVARLFASVLSGLARKKLPTSGSEPVMPAARFVLDEFPDPRTDAPVWQVLRRVLGTNEIDTAATFLTALEKAPLREHFTWSSPKRLVVPPRGAPAAAPPASAAPVKGDPKPAPASAPTPRAAVPAPPALTPRQGEFFKVVLGLTILVAAAGASSWYLAWPHGEPFARDNPSRIPARDVPKKSRLYPLVQQYDNAASPEEQLAALMGMWRVKLSWVEEERELEQWWRERLRWKYLEELNRTFEELQKTAQGEQLAAQRGVALATALTALRDCPAHPLLVEQERSWFKGCSEWLKEHKVLLDK